MSREQREPMPDVVRLRDTGLRDDLGGSGQRIITSAGNGYVKTEYVRRDIVDQIRAQLAAAEETIRQAFDLNGGDNGLNASWTYAAMYEKERTRAERAETDGKRLRESAITALNYMVGAVVACNGLKCRELNCESCCNEDDVHTFVQKAHNAYSDLRDAIDAAATPTGQGA